MAEQKALVGKTVIVTGAGRGIGRAIALSAARAGASVILASRTDEQLQEVVREVAALGGAADPVTRRVPP
ncbi:MAG TPA: SDR family NAD(P)-dependent oxidoreductase, partial [Thermoanaerobaculia bacterium]|nr:SDR family NAD(P)-dependent oxidoreductase [Thermoanaerobaculia bacterium]